ncbi:MAG: lipopolysaccharide biosynthesis protein [Woeseiaceae bacterium]|nr:lipopolysaccharide biosynthesis protein [Woeseiaceae bacterium]
MAGARRALAQTLTSQYVTMAIQFAVVIVISRLLAPAEIGIFSVGAAFIALGQLLRDFGTGQYVVQEKELTSERIRAAFTVTLGLGWSISAFVFLLSGYAAAFYEQPGLKEVLMVLAINFLILPFGTITAAYLRRQMNFRPAAVARVGSTLVSAVVSISLAYNGFSYMSLAWGGLAGSVATVLIIAVYRPANLPWLPGVREIRRVLGFGTKMSGINILGEIASLTPELVLGRTQGFHEVGLFSRTKGTVTMFARMVMTGLRPVLGSLFAEISREERHLRKPYVYGTKCLTGLAWAFFANLAVLADVFVPALYGSQWSSIVPLVQIWCVSSIVYHLTSLMDQVLVGTGNVDRLLRVTAIVQPLRIVAFLVAAFFSLEAVLAVVLLSPVLRHALLWGDVKRVAGATLGDYMEISRLSGSSALLSALVAFLVSAALPAAGIGSPLVNLGISTVAAGLAWLALLYATGHELWHELARAGGSLVSRFGR